MAIDIKKAYFMYNRSTSSTNRLDTAIYGNNPTPNSSILSSYTVVTPAGGGIGSITPVLPRYSKVRYHDMEYGVHTSSPLGGDLAEVDVTGNPVLGYGDTFTCIFLDRTSSSPWRQATMQIADRNDIPGCTFTDTGTGYTFTSSDPYAIRQPILAPNSETGYASTLWYYDRDNPNTLKLPTHPVVDLKFLSGPSRTWASGGLSPVYMYSRDGSQYGANTLQITGYSPIGPFVAPYIVTGGTPVPAISIYPSIQNIRKERINGGIFWVGDLCFGIKRTIDGLYASSSYANDTYEHPQGDYEWITRGGTAGELLDAYAPYGSWTVMVNGPSATQIGWNEGSYVISKSENIHIGS